MLHVGRCVPALSIGLKQSIAMGPETQEGLMVLPNCMRELGSDSIGRISEQNQSASSLGVITWPEEHRPGDASNGFEVSAAARCHHRDPGCHSFDHTQSEGLGWRRRKKHGRPAELMVHIRHVTSELDGVQV
jgi:hypothetical protein